MTPREWWLVYDAKMREIDTRTAALNTAPRFDDDERARMTEMFSKGADCG